MLPVILSPGTQSKGRQSMNGKMPFILSVVVLVTSLAHPLSFALEESSEVTLSRNDGYMTGEIIHLAIEMPKRCIAGDLNAIFQDMMFAEQGKTSQLLVSLQSLDGKEEYVSQLPFDFSDPQFRTDPLKFLASLANTTPTVDLKAERPSSNKVFSLTICKDSSGDNTCKRKSEEAYSDVMALLRRYTAPPTDFVSPDSIYFYSLITLGQNGASIHDASSLLTSKGFNKLASDMKLDEDTAKREFGRLKTLYSLPLKAKAGKIVISLPVFDHNRCGGEVR